MYVCACSRRVLKIVSYASITYEKNRIGSPPSAEVGQKDDGEDGRSRLPGQATVRPAGGVNVSRSLATNSGFALRRRLRVYVRPCGKKAAFRPKTRPSMRTGQVRVVFGAARSEGSGDQVGRRRRQQEADGLSPAGLGRIPRRGSHV